MYIIINYFLLLLLVYAWEQRKLGELAESFEYGLNASAKKFDGSNKYIRITDIDDISHKFNQSGVTSPDIDFASADNYKLKKGDILFARTGASVGKTYMYRESDGLVYYAGFLIRARIKSKISSEFVFQTTFTDSYNRFIKITSQRSGQPGVNAEEYSNFKIMIPNYEEQNAIGCFFKKIDDTITLHQRKLDALMQMKNGFLKQLFPVNGEKLPRVRFADFKEEWVERKLTDIVTRVNKSSSDNELPKVEFEDIFAGEGRLNKDVSTKFDNRKGIKFESEDILYGKLRPYLKNWLMTDFMGIALGDFWVLRAKESIPSFIYALIQADKYQKVANDTAGTKMPRSDWKKVSNTDFLIPKNIEEQQQIGVFFNQIDKGANLHQQKLDQLKALKKAYLQNMFI
ncbi:restriction endonuclease subunit S [Candidatus Enterococcus courvalinii]|uniref:Restriction endonuclease subunit S n=1 Tax=Candidatus Enterococcus courvalinii TaxID=2815329 RepID=A0ABS3HXY8_9ENTE|nr:restriction endonuclease subunit S [Enterococcus sp. MSG2901]MBO0481325.1 restriction endonuclease subunit S [Enterococcus sp. MSG2901]